MALEREEFHATMASMKELFNQRCDGLEDMVKEGFRKTNGRLDRAEDQIDAVERDVAVLQDRGTRDTTARKTGLGGILASAGAILYQIFRGQ